MVKLTSDEMIQMTLGYEEGKRIARSLRPCNYNNPHPWASQLWEAFEIGYYIQEKGMILGGPNHWHKGRGKTYINPDGLTLKLYYGKGKNSFGISRQS